MRRLPRIRGCSTSALSSGSTCSLRAAAASPATATLSTSTQTTHISAARTRLCWQSTFPSQRRCLSTTVTRPDKQTTSETTLAEQQQQSQQLEDLQEFYDAESELTSSSDQSFQTDLVYPARIAVPTATTEEVTDPDYAPAESGDGLEQVGGLKDWWDRPGTWGESKSFKYVGFGPVEKVTDPSVLEVLTRRAVMEALAINKFAQSGAPKEQVEAALNAVVGRDQILGIGEEVELVPAGENSTAVGVRDEEDLTAVWESLTKTSEENAPMVAEAPEISVQEARELVKIWGSDWKNGVLNDPIVKFYVAKRLQRLTGHVLHDAKLLNGSGTATTSGTTLGGIIAAMVRRPKPKKLAELLDRNSALKDLPNVQVYPRRITPIDKEQMVGRWKIIQKELQARELPVTGTGKYGKTVEWKWARGES